MEITNNNLLNIILPNDNKVIRDTLKQADINQLASSSKDASVQHLLNNLFNDITNGTKSNETIVNMLKNSNVFNELNNFPKELQSLSALVKNDPTLSTFQSKIENFMVNINQIDENNLKTQINNSGVFLESKINTSLGNLPNSITNTLLELKQSLQNMPQIDSASTIKLIDSLLSNANSMNPAKTLANMNELLSNLKTITTQLAAAPDAQTNAVIQSVQKLETLFNKELQGQTALTNGNNFSIKPEVANELKTIFSQLQTYLSATNTQANKELTTLLDKLVQPQNILQNPNLMNESKNILSQLKQLPQMQAALAYNTQSNQVSVLTTQLETIINQLSQQTPSSIAPTPLINTPIDTNVSNQLTHILNDLQKALSNFNTNASNITPLLQHIENTLLPQNFSQPQLLLNNLQQLLTKIHTTEPFSAALSNSAQTQELNQLIHKFETIVNKEILNNPIFTTPHNNIKLLNDEISHDMKAVLLQLQKELGNTVQTQNTQEMLKHIDKLLVQIDYSQLMSLTTQSNSIYLPFVWDLLEEGTIATHKGENEVFYCQINLKLKEYGKLDLLLGIYNKNHIDITMKAQQEGFKTTLQENLSELKRNLHGIGLIPTNIKLLDLKEDETVQKEGIPTFTHVEDLSLGLNIRV